MPMKSSEKSPIRSSRKYLTQVLNNRKPTRKVKPLLFAVVFIPKISIHVKYIYLIYNLALVIDLSFSSIF